MKLQKLTIHNIASIEDAVIDFDAKPLADSEVFLITGKTGAGKSTILDAICLALYADTPRLDATKMQGDTQDGDRQVKIDDPRQLMRRNTGEAFVMLTFQGSNGVRYEATWSVARARNKATGNLKSKEWQLLNLDTNLCLTREREIREEIYAAIGLDFKQFCRTTLLAQGEFTRFLNSKDDEKAEILEKITGVSVYTKIGAKVYEITNQKKRQWEDAQQLVSNTHTLTEDEIVRKKGEMEALNVQFANLNKQYEKEKKKSDWLEADIELAKKVKKAREESEEAAAVIQSEDFKHNEKIVQQWHSTIEARNWLTVIRNANKEVVEYEQQINSLSSDFAQILGGVAFEESKEREVEAEIKEIDTYLDAEKDKATIYENGQMLIAYLNTIAEGRKKIGELDNTIKTEDRKLIEVLNPAFEKSCREAEAAKLLFENQQTAVKSMEDILESLNISGLRKQYENSKDLQLKINKTIELQVSLSEAKEKMEEARKELAELLARIENNKKKLEGYTPLIHDAEVKKNTCKELLERQKDTIDKFAKTMRQKLHVGDRCPVCGQEIVSELPHEEELAELVGSLSDAFNKAEQDFNSIVAERNKMEAEIKSASQSWQRDKANLDKDKSVENAEMKLAEAYRAYGIKSEDDKNISFALTRLKEKTDLAIGEFDQKIKDGEQKEKELNEQRKTLETMRKDLEAKNSVVEKNRLAVDASKSRIVVAKELADAKQKDVSEAEKAVGALMTGKWPIEWMDEPKKFAELLKISTDKYNEKSHKRLLLEQQQKELSNSCKQASEIIGKIKALVANWGNIHESKTALKTNMISEANDLHSKVASILASIKQLRETIEEKQKLLNRFYGEHIDLTEEILSVLNSYSAQDISNKNNVLDKAKRNELTQNTLLQAVLKQQTEHQQNKPEYEEEEGPEVLVMRIQELDSQMTEANIKKGALNQELKSDEENKKRLGALMEEAENKKKEYQKWSRMNSLIGDATGSKFRKIAQSYVLTSLIHSANGYMKTLSDRYQLKIAPGTFIIMLEDAYQGYVSRAASTISGGESFLVSLSLALALSDIGQQLAVDTLFIDEGFGTLSGEPLQNAVNTLRSLHSKSGRHVGIISHVEELQDRIPIQIQVQQEGNNSSSKVKIIPDVPRSETTSI